MPAPERNDALAELRSLRTQGRLAACYPRVAPLLAELLDRPDRDAAEARSELARAGRLLAGLSAPDVRAHHPRTPVVRVLVGGYQTVTSVVDPLTAELARHGLLLESTPAEYGSLGKLSQEAAAVEADVAVCLLDAAVLLDRLPTPWPAADFEQATEQLAADLRASAAEFQRLGGGVLVLNTMPPQPHQFALLLDRASRARAQIAWRQLNTAILRLGLVHDRVAVVDLDPIVAECGAAPDVRLSGLVGIPFTEAVYAGYAREVAHLVRDRRGLVRKCLVLDLDGTLWGGELGEVGPDGIDAGERGAAPGYGSFQRAVRQLRSQGVLLAVSSKNDDALVRETLRTHPELLLHEEDFTRIDAGWEPKADSLRRIADTLGLAPEALVLADDSPAERALVRAELPGVAVLPLGEEPLLHLSRLLEDGWFGTAQLTEEDRRRAELYRAEGERAEFRRARPYEEYLRDLRISVRLAPPTAAQLPRLAQLTKRTNQFNLAGGRRSASELAALADRPGALVLGIEAEDRFGGNGLVGLVEGRAEDGLLWLDNLLLSCRVLGRGIERAVVATLLAQAARAGLREARACYRATPRNARFRSFYPELGFTDLSPTGPGPGPEAGDADLRFGHGLADLPVPPDHVAISTVGLSTAGLSTAGLSTAGMSSSGISSVGIGGRHGKQE